ncbi:unnamed protein product [Adineta steineri]|uniref:Uncharacterized protein n=1 Tax=Adineta steineri TaxID=433720 RepID=A0A814B4C5_9BILA|nr:unnamed protein product [Adineta steineri]CAF0765831.1 unnamed protein product [Adineta steineri]CAF0923066.1 unnamed protein product [Adineta steineri]
MGNNMANIPPVNGLANINQRGQASLDRSQLEAAKIFTPARNQQYKTTSQIIHCPHGAQPDCVCVKGTKYERM